VIIYHLTEFARMPLGAWINLRQRGQGAPDPHRHMQDNFHCEAKSIDRLLL
jgi:hypothetical protein